ncbi:hypothetical protein JCM6882_001440 [Rhodosporidiobolus microsporus]
MSSSRTAGAQPAVLDPYPGFERTQLPSLSNLSSLHPYQLALVPFHPEATSIHIAYAKSLFQRRRLESVSRREELGLPEKQAELRQLRRAQEWLEGRASGSEGGRGTAGQSAERMFTLAEVREREVSASKAAVEKAITEQRVHFGTEIIQAVEMAVKEEKAQADDRMKEACVAAVEAFKAEQQRQIDTAAQAAAEQPPRAPSPIPTPRAASHLPSPPVDDAPDGPFFDFDSTNPRPIPRELFQLLHIVLCTNLVSDVTVGLFYHYLLRAGKHTYPRPLAIKRSQTGSIMLAFRSAEHAQLAVSALDGATLPLARCKIRSFVRAETTGNEFRWRDLSGEVQAAWEGSRQLPAALWVGKVPGPGKGISVSEGYHDEWQNILEGRWQREQQKRRDKEAARYDYGGGDGQGYDYGDDYGDNDGGYSDGGSYHSGSGGYSDQEDDGGDYYGGGYAPPPSYAPGYYASHAASTSYQHRPLPAPPPPAPSTSYSHSADPLPFSLPQSGYASTALAPYSNPRARTWEQAQQQDGPTLDPRKRARFG